MEKKPFYLVVACCLLTACKQADVADLATREIISLEAQIGVPAVASRYAITEDMHSAFSEGDQIGLYRDAESVVGWTYSKGTWSSESIMYWESAETPHDFYAYYPFVAATRTARSAIAMPSLSKQSGEINEVGKYDFLVAQIPDRTFGAGSQLLFNGDNSFRHLSSLVKFTFKASGDLEGAVVKGIELSGEKLATETTFSFDAEEGKQISFAAGATYTTITASNLEHSMNVDKTFYFVVNHYPLATTPITLLVAYEKEGGSYSLTVNLAESNFLSGKLHPYTITIMNGVIELVGAEIRDWETDVEEIDIVVDGAEKDKTDE